MRLIQTGRLGVIGILPGLQITNVIVGAQLDNPDTPVAFGYETEVKPKTGVRWNITGPNLELNGTGEQTINLPVGEYEVTVNTP